MPIDRDSLTAADTLTGAETFDCNQGTGSARRTKKVTASNLATYLLQILRPSIIESFIVSLSDLTSVITAGTNKGYFRCPYANGFTITALYIEALIAQASGSTVTVDVNVNGSTILSTKITLDNTETDSYTAAIPPVRTSSTLAFRDLVTFDLDQIKLSSELRGLNAVVVGYQT